MVFSGDNSDQRILKYNWTEDKTGQTQPEKIFSGATFP